MTSETDFVGKEIPLETLDSEESSEGGAFEAASYGSDVQPPSLTKGYVRVHKDCCRARYRPSRTAKDAPFYLCLNKATCRSLAGGNHAVLRGGHRAEPGVYKGVYGPSGKLLAAEAGTRITPEAVEREAAESRASDRT